MGVSAGAPGLLMLPGRAGGVELVPSPYKKSGWSVPFSSPNCLRILRSILAEGPSSQLDSRATSSERSINRQMKT